MPSNDDIKLLAEANEFCKKEIDLFAAFIWRHQREHKIEPREEKKSWIDMPLDPDEIKKVEERLPVKVRLKMCAVEKEKVGTEMTDLEKKAEKDIETLKAVFEECRMRIAETKKSVYDLKLATVVKSSSHLPRVNAEKVKAYTEERGKMKRNLVKKYKTKNASLTRRT